jgi:hypothetical protein
MGRWGNSCSDVFILDTNRVKGQLYALGHFTATEISPTAADNQSVRDGMDVTTDLASFKFLLHLLEIKPQSVGRRALGLVTVTIPTESTWQLQVMKY